jgi:tellurite resistance protein TehA-like permease
LESAVNLLLWGYGLWWIAIASLITIGYFREGLPFNLGWWGYTFPLGVYAVATLRLSTVLPIAALSDVAGALVLALALIWLVVAARTLGRACTGALFVSPCLRDSES